MNTSGMRLAFESAGIQRAAVSVITGRCGSTFVGNICRQLGFGGGEETLNDLATGKVPPEDLESIRLLLARVVVNGIFYHQTTYRRWQALAQVVPPDCLGTTVTVIFRRNVVAQAISYVNAVETGIWHSNQVNAKPNPMTESERIERGVFFVKQILAEEILIRQMWPDSSVFFYEDIVVSPVETIERFLNVNEYHVDIDKIADAIDTGAATKKIVRDGYIDLYRKVAAAVGVPNENLWNRSSI
jgi:hypothetical protein